MNQTRSVIVSIGSFLVIWGALYLFVPEKAGGVSATVFTVSASVTFTIVLETLLAKKCNND